MRFVAWLVIGLVTNAVALLIASAVLDGFWIDTLAFPIVVVLFTLVEAVAHTVVEAFIEKNVQLLASFVGLAGALVTLVITDLLSSHLDVSGVTAWVLGALLIWGASLLTSLLVGKWIFRKIVGRSPA